MYLEPKLTLDKPATYRIKVQGYLDESWSDRLGGMTIVAETASGQAPVTTLIGALLDQAALMGILNCLYNMMHLPLLSVECLATEQAVM